MYNQGSVRIRRKSEVRSTFEWIKYFRLFNFTRFTFYPMSDSLLNFKLFPVLLMKSHAHILYWFWIQIFFNFFIWNLFILLLAKNVPKISGYVYFRNLSKTKTTVLYLSVNTFVERILILESTWTMEFRFEIIFQELVAILWSTFWNINYLFNKNIKNL